MNLRLIVSCFLLVLYVEVHSEDVFSVFGRIYNKCQTKESAFKCLKVQAAKIAQRALQTKSFALTEGLNVVQINDEPTSEFSNRNIREDQLERLNSTEINEILYNVTSRFLKTHRIQVNVPKMLEEGRGKKKKGGYGGLLLAAVAIKGLFMSVAYKGIAIMSGAAILIGKIALVLSVLLGLKKLVSGGHESTTFEIVKHPVYSQSHSHSTSSHHGDSDEHFYRNLESHEEMMMDDKAFGDKGYQKAYRAHIPHN